MKASIYSECVFTTNAEQWYNILRGITSLTVWSEAVEKVAIPVAAAGGRTTGRLVSTVIRTILKAT